MKLSDILDSKPAIAAPADAAGSAWEHMKTQDVRYLVVVHAGKVVGVVSRSDLGGPSGGAHRRMGRRVGDLMQKDVVTAKPSTSVRKAARLMRKHGIGCLPVLKAGKLVGVVTGGEMLRLLEKLAK
jgi:CBS domain-containing protein